MQIGLMVEGQNGLNWSRWERILSTAERLGYQCVFRSDHFTNPNTPDQDSLELWTALTFAATHTSRIEFGPLVAPVTFRHPAMTVRVASAIDDLSGGRLVLGLGAGWQEREHRVFGVPFHDFKTRFAMLTDALELTRRLYASDDPVSYKGKHFSLDGATLLPRPDRTTPILIGGNGPKRTLPLAAEYAAEWNAVFCNIDVYRERTAELERLCAEKGRDAAGIKRSLMTAVRWCADDAAVEALLAQASQRLGKGAALSDLTGMGLLAGTSEMVIEQLRLFEAAGCQRVMLQVPDYDDMTMLETWAQTILPAFKDRVSVPPSASQ